METESTERLLCEEKAAEETGSVVKSVVKFLHSLDLCARCILRYVCEKCPSQYEGSYASVANRVSTKYGVVFDVASDVCGSGDSRDEKIKDQPPCRACIGILQHECDTATLKKIEDVVQSSGYEFDGFTFAVTVPLTTLVYQHSLLLHLKEKFRSFYFDVMTVESLPSIKDVIKWVCGPALGNLLGVFFQHESPFKISIYFEGNDESKDLEFLAEVDPSRFKERKKKKRAPEIPLYSVSSIKKALTGLTSADEFRKYTCCPPNPPLSRGHCLKVICSHGALLLGGRYNKYTRCLPQTPWVIDGIRHKESSVQEKICDIIMPKIKADECRFSSSGREDVDVRMLGTGRPFVLEFVNPHKTFLSTAFLHDMQQQINSSAITEVAVRDLQVITKDDYGTLKDGETSKTKTYSALIWTKEIASQDQLEKLAKIKDLALNQKTPLRVLHRRPLAVRERMVHEMFADRIDDHHFRLKLKTMAGTYVKEFVHGDFGRTKPNMGTLLGMDADILELDVESVDVIWPPSQKEEMTITNRNT